MALAALDRFDLADAALQRADTLSGGQQQRVAIARALLQEPRDRAGRRADRLASIRATPRSSWTRCGGINREDGITVLCNLHHLDTAREYCDRIVAMQCRPRGVRRPARRADGGAGARHLRRGRGRVRGAGRRSPRRPAAAAATERRRRPPPPRPDHPRASPMLTRRQFRPMLAAGTSPAAPAPAQPDMRRTLDPPLAMPTAGRRPWAQQVPQLRVGLLGGENEADRLGPLRRLPQAAGGAPSASRCGCSPPPTMPA